MYAAVEARRRVRPRTALTIADKQEREDRLDEIKAGALEASSAQQFEGREKELSAAVRSRHQEARPPARPHRRRPHRRPRARGHPHAVGRGRGAAAGARLGAVRARRDPDPRRHHAEHAPHGAAARHPRAGDAQALHAQLQLPALLDRRDRPRGLAQAPRDRPRSARRARPRCRCCRAARSSRTRSARSPRRSGSNGSTSMGSVCASTLSLLNAGVPLRAPVAGIAMGLISDEVDGQTAVRRADRHPRRRGRVR